jgi:PAS domain S-box-containing protein
MHNERKTKGELIAEVSELRQRLIIFEEEQQKLRQSLNERKRAENIMHARIRLLKFAESQSFEEFTQATLDELEALTDSKIGFYHLVEADQRTLSLQTWSTNTLQHMCKAEGKGQHYDIAEAGVWVDCMHQRRPVIHNNYHALPHRKGMPPGHAPVVRELVVPIFRNSKIVAIIGVGNKPSDYDEWDVEMASLLGDLSWDITERKRAEEELHKHREELQSIMDSVPAMIFYKDKENRFIQTNQALAEAMGLSKEELKGRSIFDLYPEHAEDYWKDDLEVMSTGISKRNIVEPMETSTGLKWVQTDKIPYKDALGNIIGIIGFAQDITERKMMEEALRRAYDELEERVTERTAALRLANEQLLWEIEERQQVEDRLRDSEARFTAFMEHLPGLAVMRDMEGRYLFANRAWEETDLPPKN